jgi:hypothetical protein
VPGFGNVVKLAVSLNCAVKIEGGQPDESLVAELQRLARFYLHQSTVSEPIEFFHSLFLAMYHHGVRQRFVYFGVIRPLI